MPAIHLLTENRVLENKVMDYLNNLDFDAEVRISEFSSFSSSYDPGTEINVFIVESGCAGIDYRSVAETFKSLGSEHGVAIMLIGPEGSEPGKSAAHIEADAALTFPFNAQDLSVQLEHLIKISELRAMNQNLNAQLSYRVSRLAGLEKQLLHTNWILQALNRCSEVIIKANDESQMLSDVCDILSEGLGSSLVIVGYAEMDAQSSVRIVAASGEKQDIAKYLKMSWDMSPRGQGPTGTAIRTGKSVFIQNPSNDSSIQPWKEMLEANNIKYILSLPIAYAGVGFGALTIYGGRKTEFSANDLEYMERVAQNMGYGIWFLRHRNKRKLVEKELQKANELFTLAMEATEDGLWDLDVSTGKTYFSPRWYTMLGYEPNELPMNYESFKNIVHPDDFAEVEQQFSRVMEKGEHYSLEFRARTKDGKDRWILCRGKIVKRDENNRPLRIVGTHFDITQRKTMEQELGEARNKAESANQAKDRFLEAMSHELRTPLNGIMSILQTLAEADLSPSEKEYIQMALDSSRQLLVSINKILELSSLQKGIQCIHTQEFDIVDEMTKITGFFMPMAKNKNLYLELDISDDLPHGYSGDISLIRQIIWNFMDNAIKFTQKGGVLLKVSSSEFKDSSAKSGSIPVMFEVIDTGTGILEEVLEDLFEPFGVRDNAQLKRQSGYGIGLSVCRQLADSIGAKVGADSASGRGSRFYLVVDLAMSEQSAKPEACPRVSRESSEDVQIMVVEDEKINMMLIERMLQKRGFQVLTAADGDEALAVMKANPNISLVLMDIMVPKHDGFELAQMIREGRFSGLKDVPIIAVTALADSDSRQKCFDSGMNAYLSKPIDNQELMGMVKKYIESW